MIKIIRIALVFVLLLSAGCSEYGTYIYETRSMALSNADNSGESPEDAGSSVPKEAYALKMSYEMHLLDATDTDVNESGFRNQDEVVNFEITSPNAFNGVAPNTSLKHLFNFSRGATGMEITEESYGFIASGSGGRSAISPGDTWITEQYLLLMNPPSATGSYTFSVTVSFSDGRTLSESVTVFLN